MKNLSIISIIVATAAILFNSCGEEASGPGDGGPYGPNTVICDIEYNEGVEVFSGDKKDALIKIDTIKVPAIDPISGEETEENNYNFTFSDLSVEDVPEVGEVLIIEGMFLTKVKSKSADASGVYVETEPATLKDAIKNGEISWDITPEIEAAEVVKVGDKNVKPTPLGDGYEYEFEWLDRKYTIWMDPKGTSPNGLPEIQVNFICEKIDSDNGRVTGTFGAKGTTRLPRQTSKIVYKNSELDEFESESRALRSELTIEYVAEMSFGGTQVMTFPNLTVRVPLQSFTAVPLPFPMYVNLGLGFMTTVNMPAVDAFATAKVKLILDSDTGFDYDAGITANAKLNDHDLGKANWAIGEMSLAPTPLEVRWDVSCPRAGIEIAGSELAWTAAVFSVRSKLIVPSLCKASLYQVRLDGGYSLGILGYEIAGNEGSISEVSREEKSPECP